MGDVHGPSHSQCEQSEADWLVTYHGIAPRQTPYLYDVSTTLFEEHLKLLTSRNAERKQSAAVTFDDGHLSNYENAFPILERLNLRAAFFLLVGSIGNSPNCITWEQAREMSAAGHRMQSHGWSHTLLTSCSEKQFEQEMDRSKKVLEDRLGTEVDSISAPGGRWNRRVLEACRRAGYKFFYHSNPWADRAEVEGVTVRGRMMITGKMDARALQRILDSSPARRKIQLAAYSAKEIARTIMGDTLYHGLWKWVANFDSGSEMEIALKSKTAANSNSDWTRKDTHL